MTDLHDLVALRDRVVSQRETLHRLAADATHDQRWGSHLAGLERPNAFHLERQGRSPEKLRAKRPRGAAAVYGMDRRGELVAMHREERPGTSTLDWFRIDERDSVWFSQDSGTVEVARKLLDGSRLVGVMTYLSDLNWSVERYFHDDAGRLTDIEVEMPDVIAHIERNESRTGQQRYVLEYDERGELLLMELVAAPRNVPVYARIDGALETGLAHVRTDLVDWLSDHLPSVGTLGAIRAVALHYDAETPLPPALELLPSTAEGALRKRLAGLEWLNPAEWNDAGHEVALPANLGQRARLLGLAARAKGKERRPRALLHEIARELNGRRLGGTGELADDFFAYAIDVGAEHLEEDLERSVPDDQLPG